MKCKLDQISVLVCHVPTFNFGLSVDYLVVFFRTLLRVLELVY